MSRLIFLTFVACITLIFLGSQSGIEPDFKSFIEASPQRSGNPDSGYNYLITGDYVSSGIPMEIYKAFGPRDTSNVLGRKGEAAVLPPQFNLSTNEEGVDIVSPNCLTCHGDYLNGEYIVGLGNTSFDYRVDMQGASSFMGQLISNRFGKGSPQFRAIEAFLKASQALTGYLKTEARGVNPADKLTAVLIAHRDPSSLEWSDSLLLDIPDKTIPTDVPPWWVLKKKHAMFYTGIGRGDFSRFLMASSILTLKDSAQAARIDKRFPDVLSWINNLEAPNYPESINKSLANKGKKIFEKNCSGCHGTYGEEESYPNYLIHLDKIGTDPALSHAYTDSLYKNFIDWYNESWFVEGDHPGKLVIEDGYVAPPLDGIWASAPYLHNGSVPNLWSMLDSKSRPDYWRRSFESTDYDFEQVGWNYETFPSGENCNCYDTSKEAYGNQGHTFGDKLSDNDRRAVIEYLKTL